MYNTFCLLFIIQSLSKSDWHWNKTTHNCNFQHSVWHRYYSKLDLFPLLSFSMNMNCSFHFLQYCGSIFKSRIHCLYMDIRKILKTQPETGYYNILKCFLFFIKKEEEKIVAGSAGLVKYGSNRIHKACFTLYCAALSEKTAVATELFRSLKIAASRSAASW